MSSQERGGIVALREAVALEGARFALPPEWQYGREVRHVIAADGSKTTDSDDGISLERRPGGGRIIGLSIADTGTYLAPNKTISKYAGIKGWSDYAADGSVIDPMIPAPISDHLMSLRAGAERPGLTVHLPMLPNGTILVDEIDFTHDRLAVTSVTYNQINAAADSPWDISKHASLREFESCARLLYAARHGEETEALCESRDDEEEIELIESRGRGQFIVSELTIAVSKGVAAYAHRNNVPVLYRVRGGVYNSIPDDNFLLGKYIHFTSPLRRFADYMAHANIVAFRAGRELPYPMPRLEWEGGHLNRLEAGRRASNPYRVKRHLGNVVMAKTMLDRLTEEDAQVNVTDIVEGLFGKVIGEGGEVHELREWAANYLAGHIALSNAVLRVAMRNEYIARRPIEERPGYMELETHGGRRVSYRSSCSPLGLRSGIAIALGRLVNVEVHPERVAARPRPERIKKHPLRSLKELHKTTVLDFFAQYIRNREGVSAIARIAFDGKLLAWQEEAETPGPALHLAALKAAQWVLELEEFPQYLKRPLAPDSYTTLVQRYQKQHRKPFPAPEYPEIYTGIGPYASCRLRYDDISATAYGRSKKDARDKAAAILWSRLT